MKSILNSLKQIKIDEYLTVPGHHHIFAVGDNNDIPVINGAGGALHAGVTAGSIITSLLAGNDKSLVPFMKGKSQLGMMLGTEHFVGELNSLVTNDMNLGKMLFENDLGTTRIFNELKGIFPLKSILMFVGRLAYCKSRIYKLFKK